MPPVKVAKVKTLPIGQICPNIWNPNRMSPEAFERLKKEIQDVGFIDPVQVVPLEGSDSYRLIGGEHRWKAAHELGMKEIPAVILSGKEWTDEDLQKFVTLRLNHLHGELDPEKFAALYEEMARKYGEDALQNLMGYVNIDGWKKLVSGMKEGLKASGLPDELVEKFAEEAEEATCEDDLNRILQKLLAEYGDTLNLNFMVFTFKSKEHLYVISDEETFALAKAIAEESKRRKVDINQVLHQVLARWEKAAAVVPGWDAGGTP
jgi:hypothetical protein